MRRYIALLRGINVGGHRKILMADLKSLLSEAGLRNISTYIQSGNVAFESDKSTVEISELIYKSIKYKYGYEVPVIVREKKELDLIIESNPYLKKVGKKIETLYVIFFEQVPAKNLIEEFNELNFGADEFSINPYHAFINYETKASASKLSLSVFERKLKITCTARNWKTVLKLKEMALK